MQSSLWQTADNVWWPVHNASDSKLGEWRAELALGIIRPRACWQVGLYMYIRTIWRCLYMGYGGHHVYCVCNELILMSTRICDQWQLIAGCFGHVGLRQLHTELVSLACVWTALHTVPMPTVQKMMNTPTGAIHANCFIYTCTSLVTCICSWELTVQLDAHSYRGWFDWILWECPITA